MTTEIRYDIEKSRLGVCFIIPYLDYPLNIEFSKINDINIEIDTVNDRLSKIGQSAKLDELYRLQIFFTFMNIKLI